MATFSFRCDRHGEFDTNAAMEHPPRFRRCPECERWSERVFTVPQFCEDRQRFFKNSVDGSNFSYSLGKPMPESRRAYERDLREIGAEPVSPSSMPDSWKEALAYKRHVESGGARDSTFEHARHPSTGPGKTTVLGELKKSGITLG